MPRSTPGRWAARAALAICALTFAVLLKSNRQAAFGVVWLLATLAPVLNVRWMTSNPFAERYLYLASVGFCWIVGWAGVRGVELLSARGSQWRVALPLAAGADRRALGAIASSLEIATGAIISPFTPRPWRFRRTPITSTTIWGSFTGSRETFRRQKRSGALPCAWRPTANIALHNLGLVANAEKHYPEAENLFLRALAIRPNYRDAHLDLGKTYEATGRLQEAEAQLRTAENLAPLSVRAHNALSEFYFDRRQLRESEAEARRSVEIEPTPARRRSGSRGTVRASPTDCRSNCCGPAHARESSRRPG